MLRIVVPKPEPHYYDHNYGQTLGIMDELDAIHFACEDFCDALDEATETLYDMPWLWTR